MQVSRDQWIGIGLVIVCVVLSVSFFAYIKQAEVDLLSTVRIDETGNCVHPAGQTCPYQRLSELTIPKWIGGITLALVFLVGLWLTLSPKRTAAKLEVARKSRHLEGDEKKIFDLIISAEGILFQNELVEKSGLSKVKVTRMLDKLESRGLVERRRRGMTNVILQKN